MNFKEEFDKSPMKVEITLSEEVKIKLNCFVDEVIKTKKTENHHKVDNGQEFKRWYTGFSGESALEEYLRVEYVDLTVGDSKQYHVSDLSKLKLDIGVKTVESGKFPIIFKRSYSPQVIIVKDNDSLYICGMATVEVLNKYQSDDLILSPSLKARGTKTGFYGFEHLKPFNNIDDLKILTKKFPNNTNVIIDDENFILKYSNGKYHLISDENSYKNLEIGKFNRKLKNLVLEKRAIIK